MTYMLVPLLLCAFVLFVPSQGLLEIENIVFKSDNNTHGTTVLDIQNRVLGEPISLIVGGVDVLTVITDLQAAVAAYELRISDLENDRTTLLSRVDALEVEVSTLTTNTTGGLTSAMLEIQDTLAYYQIAVDVCEDLADYPCVEGAETCQHDGFRMYTCTDIDDCLSSPCQNDQPCINDPNGAAFTCNCGVVIGDDQLWYPTEGEFCETRGTVVLANVTAEMSADGPTNWNAGKCLAWKFNVGTQLCAQLFDGALADAYPAGATYWSDTSDYVIVEFEYPSRLWRHPHPNYATSTYSELLNIEKLDPSNQFVAYSGRTWDLHDSANADNHMIDHSANDGWEVFTDLMEAGVYKFGNIVGNRMDSEWRAENVVSNECSSNPCQNNQPCVNSITTNEISCDCGFYVDNSVLYETTGDWCESVAAHPMSTVTVTGNTNGPSCYYTPACIASDLYEAVQFCSILFDQDPSPTYPVGGAYWAGTADYVILKLTEPTRLWRELHPDQNTGYSSPLTIEVMDDVTQDFTPYLKSATWTLQASPNADNHMIDHSSQTSGWEIFTDYLEAGVYKFSGPASGNRIDAEWKAETRSNYCP